MAPILDILSSASVTPVLNDQLEVIHAYDNKVPDSVNYNFLRLKKHQNWNIEDVGSLEYQFGNGEDQGSYLELRFCVSGNKYCDHKDCKGNVCKNVNKDCSEKIDTVDIFRFKFKPSHLSQFSQSTGSNTLADKVINFSHTNSFTKTVSICGRTRMVLENMINTNYEGSMLNIFMNGQIQMVLLYSLECLVDEKELEFTCKFLSNSFDREKIIKAREILLQNIGTPLTIKELSRKVAINECYLKKGFKEMFGTTVFDFYQSQRMEHAKYLLYDKGLSVTEVSVLLGYSSISHFSTAFKRHTGLKPCELLFSR